MDKTLLAVIVGGLIASIAPIAKLVADHFRWKKEMQISHLREERDRLERLSKHVMSELDQLSKDGTYEPDTAIIGDILTTMPEEVGNVFREWVYRDDFSKKKFTEMQIRMSAEMNVSLANIDQRIKDLIDS